MIEKRRDNKGRILQTGECQEKDINVQISRGICPDGSTVCELVDRYLVTRTGLRPSTQAGYKTVRNILAKEEFSKNVVNTRI